MIENWPEYINRVTVTRNGLQRLNAIYGRTIPGPPSSENELIAVEKSLKGPLDCRFLEFLKNANGWPRIWGGIDIFGTADLTGGENFQHALEFAENLESEGVFQASGYKLTDLRIVATARKYTDHLITITASPKEIPGTVLWFESGAEVGRYQMFDDWFEFISKCLLEEFTSNEK